jgi:hypothetical protein
VGWINGAAAADRGVADLVHHDLGAPTSGPGRVRELFFLLRGQIPPGPSGRPTAQPGAGMALLIDRTFDSGPLAAQVSLTKADFLNRVPHARLPWPSRFDAEVAITTSAGRGCRLVTTVTDPPATRPATWPPPSGTSAER